MRNENVSFSEVKAPKQNNIYYNHWTDREHSDEKETVIKLANAYLTDHFVLLNFHLDKKGQ